MWAVLGYSVGLRLLRNTTFVYQVHDHISGMHVNGYQSPQRGAGLLRQFSSYQLHNVFELRLQLFIVILHPLYIANTHSMSNLLL